MDSKIGKVKLVHTPEKQDANEIEGKDHTAEDLASKPRLPDNFPVSYLDSAVRASSTLVSKSENQCTGETGEEPEIKDHCRDSSFGSIPVVSGTDYNQGASGDSRSSLVLDNSSVEMERDQGLVSATDEAPATSGSMPLRDKFESLCGKEDSKTFDSAKSPGVDEFPASDNLSKAATVGVGSQLGAIFGSSMVSGPGAVASVDQRDPGTVLASSPQASPEDIDVEKFEGPLQEQDTNGKEGKDSPNEVLASQYNLADNLPSLATLDPALNSLVSSSQNHSAGESGESNHNKEPHEEVVCDNTFVSVADVSGIDNYHRTLEDSPSLVPDSNPIKMEKDQGSNGATDKAAATSGSMPLAGESSKFESLCREEDEKVIVSAENPCMGNLSEGATVVESQLVVISVSSMASDNFAGPVAAASVDHSDVPSTSPQCTTQDTIDPSVEHVPKGRLSSLFTGVNN